MDEGILEVDEVAGDRVVELLGVGELHGVGLITCEGEVIVQGDEGPFAESRRLLIVMESPSVIRNGKRKRNNKK